MQVDLRDVKKKFSEKYQNFVAFQSEEQYAPYWQKCMEAAGDAELLNNIIFCNDIFKIPPVKTFLMHLDLQGNLTKEYVEKIVEDPFIRRGIGAFWGAVFKGVLGYRHSKSVTVSMENFGIKTASIFRREKANGD